ncbi:MAG: acetate--CoA ligase [Gammaproteobacteria bacterium]|nr:acetate--CoA ligase [Gammaproteobacteria bacterium]
MSDKKYPVTADFAQNALIDNAKYTKMYQESINNPESFWNKHGERLHWFKPYTKVKDTSFAHDDVHIKWFADGELNACYNCIDRHLEKCGDQAAIIWEGDTPDKGLQITYKELHQQVCRLANGLKELGYKKGDVATIYMPMIPEAAIAMLACARLGIIHSVVFGGFSPESLANRIDNANSNLVITADEGLRGGKIIPLKKNVDEAATKTDKIKHILMVKYTDAGVGFQVGRDVWYHELVERQQDDCPAEPMNAEDPLFILYTSGSTGAPKGLQHSTGGYMLWVTMTHEYVFDYRPGEVYWCGADVGWVTGHSYMVYGPLGNGATTIIYEGLPNYPTSARWGEIIDKHNVGHFYTAPTAIRALMREGDEIYSKCSLKSLRVLGTVGEPINPNAWEWYRKVLGRGEVPIVDTWWQTETGGHMITPLPGATELKPGSATLPFFGVQPALMDKDGNELSGEANGALVIKDSWPGQSRSIYGNHQRFVDTYFSDYKGYYFSGDGARRDADGYYWITGRMDDVLNVSGHRLGTAEIESALVGHAAVAESAVIGYPHEIKGQGIFAYVTLVLGVEGSQELHNELLEQVRQGIGPIAKPDIILFTPALPKTRSGKIMRRILRKIATAEYTDLGDLSTLADTSVVDELIAQHEALTAL